MGSHMALLFWYLVDQIRCHGLWPACQSPLMRRHLALSTQLSFWGLGGQTPLCSEHCCPAQSIPGSWASRCVDLSASLDVPTLVGVAAVLSLPSAVCKHGFLRDRVVDAASSLTTCHVHGLSLAVNSGPRWVVGGRSCLSSHAPRWTQDPFLGGRGARHLSFPLLCPPCEAPSGDLSHCLSECPAFSDLREQWSQQCSVNPNSFHSGFAILVHAHVAFVGQVWERFVSL